MKKIFIKASTIVFALISINCIAQKKVKEKDILKSSNIEQLEEFLAKTHPNDPRNPFLKKRIIELKNLAWVKGRENAKPMEARIIKIDDPKPIVIDSTAIIEQEFITQYEKEKLQHKDNTITLLNTLFDNQKTSPDVAILIKNNSKCNIIIDVQGDQQYSVAIPKEKDSTLVVKKGNYNLSTKICNVKYNSHKTIQKSMLISLNEPQIKK